MVFSFHGGPEGQDRPAFRSDYQALLSQGIAVFAPNVRGSYGFGKKFVNLDNGALRANGVRDIKACVDHVVASGFADPRRLGITGGSYGGYMTMAGLTEFPDMFANVRVRTCAPVPESVSTNTVPIVRSDASFDGAVAVSVPPPKSMLARK